MALGRAAKFSVLLTMGLSIAVVFPCVLTIGPAFGQTGGAQGAVVGLLEGMFQRRHERAEQRNEKLVAIARMQNGLTRLDYYDGPIDGDFGPQTAEALTAYRRSTGRPNSAPLSLEELAEIENSDQVAGNPPAEEPESVYDGELVRADTPKLSAKLDDVAAWIVIASRPTPEEARSFADDYVEAFPSTTVLGSANGTFVITIGWLNKDQGKLLNDSLISRGLVPRDSFLSSGRTFTSPIWSVDGQRLRSKLDLLRYALLRTTPANGMISGFQEQVTGLSDPGGDNLSLRADAAPSSKELRQLPEGTLLKVRRAKDGWHQVELLNGMIGWVSLNRTAVVAKEPISPDEQVRGDRITRDAHLLHDTLVVYLNVHPDTPDIASIAQEFSTLRSAMDNDDVPLMETTLGTLKRQLEAVPGWSDFVDTRTEESRQAEIEALGKAVTLGLRHQGFLRVQIAKNLTSPDTAALATLYKRYDSALPSRVLSTLTDLNDQFMKLVSDIGAMEAYNTWMAAPVPIPATEKPEIDQTQATPKNHFLLAGELTDLVMIFNASGKAPHVARNIRGDIEFDGREADACVLHPAAGKIGVTQVEDILKEKVDTVHLEPSPCLETNLQSHDVLIATRGDLLRQQPSYLAPLLGLVEDGTFEEFKTLTGEEAETSKRAPEVRAHEIENAILAGTPEGYGLIKIENGSSVICMATAEQEDAHRALINEQRKVLLALFKAAPEIQRKTMEAAYIAAKRDQCGAIYSSRADLSELLQSFRRDHIRVSVVPLWFEPQIVTDRADKISLANEKLAQQEQDRKKELELRKQQEQGNSELKGVQEAKLQAQHGAQAQARAEEIAHAIKLLTNNDETWATAEFPGLVSWYRSRIAEGWEFVGLDQKVADYGTADWKSRQLEVVFAEVSIAMKNKVLGEKETSCFSFGLIFDAEFQIHREPFFERCHSAAKPSRAWKQAQGFRGQWVVE